MTVPCGCPRRHARLGGEHALDAGERARRPVVVGGARHSRRRASRPTTRRMEERDDSSTHAWPQRLVGRTRGRMQRLVDARAAAATTARADATAAPRVCATAATAAAMATKATMATMAMAMKATMATKAMMASSSSDVLDVLVREAKASPPVVEITYRPHFTTRGPSDGRPQGFANLLTVPMPSI